MNKRIRGWEQRFIHLVEDELAKPFSWESSNCGHMVYTAIRACHGEHPFSDHLRACHSEQAAMDYLYIKGGFLDILNDWFEPVHAMMAGQADIGLIEASYYDRHRTEYVKTYVGCVVMDGQLVGKREKGAFRIPLTTGTKFFKV